MASPSMIGIVDYDSGRLATHRSKLVVTVPNLEVVRPNNNVESVPCLLDSQMILIIIACFPLNICFRTEQQSKTNPG